MAKIPYSKLGLKVNKDTVIFKFNDMEIEVLQYLPIEEKYDIIAVTLQKSREESGLFNELYLQMYFELNLIYSYTNITFTDKQREDEFKLYDSLRSSGFIDAFLEVMEEDDYTEIFSMMELIKDSKLQYDFTVASIINRFINDLPRNAEIAADIVENFNPEQYKLLQGFADRIGFRGKAE